MQIAPEIKPAVWGAIGGAVALAIIGFTWGGWVTGSTSEQSARARADTAVAAALAPFCVAKFQQQADAPVRLVELKRMSSWERSSFVEKGGWSTLADKTSPDSAVARVCADMLQKL